MSSKTADAAETLLAKGFALPSSATIHGGPQKVFKCSAPGCDWKIGADELRADVKRVQHARSHADDQAIRDYDREHDPTFGEGDPEKLSFLKRRFSQLIGKVEDPLNPKRY
jgi:predicted small metal-binding protein